MDQILTLYEPLQVLTMSKMKSVILLDVLKMYPVMRKLIKKYKKTIPMEFKYNSEYIMDNDLKYLKHVNSVVFIFAHITNKGLKHLKGVQSIHLFGCDKITDKGIEYIKNVPKIRIVHCNNVKKKLSTNA